MARLTVIWVGLVVVGVLCIAGAPPDPQYSVSVYGPTTPPTDERVVAYENLSAEKRALFSAALDGDQRFAEPPNVTQQYVAYRGEVYLLESAVHEGPVLSLVMPPFGTLLVVAGAALGGYGYLRRS